MTKSTHHVFNEANFYDALGEDLDSAMGLVIIQSPFVSVRRIDRLAAGISRCVRRGVRVCAYTQEIRKDVDAVRLDGFDSAVTLLRVLGVHVNIRPSIHEKLAIVDDRIFWDGSLNILSHYNTKERMTRWDCRSKVLEAMRYHDLDSCADCQLPFGKYFRETDQVDFRHIGAQIRIARKAMGWSQVELAVRAKMQASQICRIERGCRNASLSNVIKILRELGLELCGVPWHMLPAMRHLSDRGIGK